MDMYRRGRRGLTKRTQSRNKKSAHLMVKKIVRTRNPRVKRRIARRLHKKIKYS